MTNTIECPGCAGFGTCAEDRADSRGEHYTVELTCAECDGTGLVAAACNHESHERLKRDEAAWAGLDELRPIVDDDGRPLLELRNCVCGSTLARDVVEREPPDPELYDDRGLEAAWSPYENYGGEP